MNGPDPGGHDLSLSSDFDLIAEARRSDDPSLDRGEWTRELKQADWPRVSRLCFEALRDRTKDLRLAGWYLEARTQVDGFAGLAEGYTLLARLCETWWLELHPRGEDDEERLGCLRWIAAQSPRWIRATRLTGDTTESLDTLPTLVTRTSSPVTGAGTVAAWRASMPPEQLAASMGVIRTINAAVNTLDVSIEMHAPGEGPSWRAVREALADVAAVFEPIVPSLQTAGTHASDGAVSERTESAPWEPVDRTNPGPADAGTSDSFAKATPGVATREQALQCLRDVAIFFRRTEPHSPVAYLAEKAAHWGTLPLHEWLAHVLGDGEALARMRDILEINRDGTFPSGSTAP